MDEESVGLSTQGYNPCKSGHVFVPDVGAVTLGLDGDALAVNDNLTVYTTVPRITVVVDGLVTFALESIE